MRSIHCASLRAALAYAFAEAKASGADYQIGACGDPYGWDGYAVIQHEGDSYPGISAPHAWCWVATIAPDGWCEHASGYLNRWDAEISRAKRAAGIID